jgi:hypothetical protein
MNGLDKDDIIRMVREVADKDKVDPVHNDMVTLTVDELGRLLTAEHYTICALLNRLVDTYEDLDRQGSAEDIRKLIRHIRARGNDAA